MVNGIQLNAKVQFLVTMLNLKQQEMSTYQSQELKFGQELKLLKPQQQLLAQVAYQLLQPIPSLP